MAHMLETGVFWYGDNLDVMREYLTSDGEVDLIYLDPPFNSNRMYGAFFTEEDESISDAQLTAFEDYWRWGIEAQDAYDQIMSPRRRYLVPATLIDSMQMLRRILGDGNMMAYIAMMSVRLVEMRRLLKETGTIYVHCDPTASHYLKVVMDSLFGTRNFRSEVVWKRTGAHGSANRWGDVHDTLLFYSKSDTYRWNKTSQAFGENYVASKYRFTDDRGRYRLVVLTGNGLRGGESGKPWRGYNPSKAGRHWAVPSDAIDVLRAEGVDIPSGVHERLELLYQHGLIRFPEKSDGEKGVPEYKRYRIAAGAPLQDVITDIPPLNSQAKERTGYPTQKPVALLERIIDSSSRAGDIILDPFCGCGTAVIAAQRLGRRWIGIDVTHVAVSVLKKRMDESFPGLTFRVRGEPEDVASAQRLAREKPLEFQAWMVDKVGGVPVSTEKEKKVAKGGGDDNRDGFVLFRDDPKAERSRRMLLSVKAGESYVNKPEIVDALGGALERHGATCAALLMSHKPSDGTYKRAAGYKTWTSDTFAPGTRYPVVQIVTAEDVFSPGWRGLNIPGENTSLKSQPPPGTPGASEELFDATGQPKKPAKPGPKKTTSRPPVPGQIPIPGVPEEFRMIAERTSTKRRK